GSSSVLPLGAQGSLECAAGVVEPPLHGSGGDSEGSGDGGNRFMSQVVEDEERSFVGIQAVERTAQDIGRSRLLGRAGAARGSVVGLVEGDLADATSGPHPGATAVHEHPPEPCVKSLDIAQARKLVP